MTNTGIECPECGTTLDIDFEQGGEKQYAYCSNCDKSWHVNLIPFTDVEQEELDEEQDKEKEEADEFARSLDEEANEDPEDE